MLKNVIFFGAVVGIALAMLGNKQDFSDSYGETNRFTETSSNQALNDLIDNFKKQDGKPIYVTGSSVRVRSGPGTIYDQVHSFKRGQKLLFDGERDGKWIKVVAPKDGIVGWMHGDYLSFEVPKVRTVAVPKPEADRGPSDVQLRREIIRSSLASYQGSCPCPYNRDRVGRRCGGRSAYSRPGGRSPICYDRDVTSSMLASWRARTRGAATGGN